VWHSPFGAWRLLHPAQVFGRDKSMSIVALMNLEGLQQHFIEMVQEAALVGARMLRRACRACCAVLCCAAPFRTNSFHHEAAPWQLCFEGCALVPRNTSWHSLEAPCMPSITISTWL